MTLYHHHFFLPVTRQWQQKAAYFSVPTSNQTFSTEEKECRAPRNLKFHHPKFTPKRIPSRIVWPIFSLIQNRPNWNTPGQLRPAWGYRRGWVLVLRKDIWWEETIIPQAYVHPQTSGRARVLTAGTEGSGQVLIRQSDWASSAGKRWIQTGPPLSMRPLPIQPSLEPKWVSRWDIDDWKVWSPKGYGQLHKSGEARSGSPHHLHTG